MLFARKYYQPEHIMVKESNLHGRGVFATRQIDKGSLIEEAPAVYLTAEERELLKRSSLFNYYFLVNNVNYPAVFGFGYSSFYNHAPQSNCIYSFSRKKNTIRFYAFRKIAMHEEITINYNGDPGNSDPVYFPGNE